jgi:hypothetical protein
MEIENQLITLRDRTSNGAPSMVAKHGKPYIFKKVSASRFLIPEGNFGTGAGKKL